MNTWPRLQSHADYSAAKAKLVLAMDFYGFAPLICKLGDQIGRFFRLLGDCIL
jgi:hypothetical protein